MSLEDNNDFERVEDLWFPDADLILRAENTLFRVHSSILGARSCVFRDMVAFPQPETPDSEGDTHDGKPVVRLHDSAAEVEVFLRAVFDSSFFMPPPSPTDVATVIGVMRLAHKYDIQYLFRRALSHLDSLYPVTCAKMLDINLEIASHHVKFPSGLNVDLITLRAASEVGAQWILPAAYYNICTFHPKHILSIGENWNILSIHQQQTCLVSQAELSRATTSTHQFLRYMPFPSCLLPENCQQAASESQDLLHLDAVAQSDLLPLSEWICERISIALCPNCDKIGRDQFDKAQEIFWGRLPAIFGLPEWDELNKMRREVLGLEEDADS
ncbi:hypothetical protein B0H17DRAFT_985496 [Mycena rosella]|uniref:BTB domain-containing protein n=1 Tax=Mycena rosella TaxID=1033263 RepID=A0AAD7D919_MYCRO|nr:hypothetical protein B0H17DRAFT_985496 [Mycena rosella]